MEQRLSQADSDRLIRLYEDRLDTFGNDVRTVGWGSQEDQTLRFDMLCRDIDVSNCSILDVGCGLGDLVPYLDTLANGNFDYTGIDLSTRLIEQAKVNCSGDNLIFLAGDILDDGFRKNHGLDSFDLVFLSGALSFRIDDNISFAKTMIKKLFGLCEQSLSLNFLSTFVDFQDEKNFHYDPGEMLNFAKSLTPQVSLYHDYPLWEFTLKMRRDPY